MNRKFIYLIILTILSFIQTNLFGQNLIENKVFNTEKWATSSSYRYDIVLRSRIFSEFIQGKTEKEIADDLGNPIEKKVEKNSAIHLKTGWTTVEETTLFTYCLDIENKELKKTCKGSMIIIHFYKNSVEDVTIINVE